MSRRQELKEKEILQLKFQTAIANNSNMVKQWINGSKPDKEFSKQENTIDKQVFMNLPAISPGKTLSSQDTGKTETIGTYMDGKRKEKGGPMGTAMNSLINRTRNVQRKVAKETIKTNKNLQMTQRSTTAHKNTRTQVAKANDYDSNSDDEEIKKIGIKKPKLLI